MTTFRHFACCALTGGALALSACAAAPLLPTESMQAADIAIATADGEKAAEFAPVELNSARDRIGRARVAVAKDPEEKDVMLARRLANEAQADAELASAKARLARAAAVNTELQNNINTLRDELKRTGAGS